MRVFCLVTIGAAVWVGAAGGCRSGQPVTRTDLIGTSPTRGVSPEGYVDKRERLRRALEGLVFESGFVEIDTVARPRFGGSGDEGKALERYREGLELIEQNERTAAIQTMKEAILIAPELAVVYDGLGTALLTKGEIEYAMAAFRTALRIDDEFIDARYHLAGALNMEMRLTESIEEYGRVLAADAQYRAGNSRLAIAHYYQGDYADAWHYVHAADAAESAEGGVPPQFRSLLGAKMPDPQR